MELNGRIHLYGRGSFLRTVQDSLLAHPEHPILIHGPSGIGKSALLEQLDVEFRQRNFLSLRYKIVSAAHSLQHFLGSLVSQLIEQSSINESDLGRFRKALNALNREYSLSLITAGLLDL